MIMKYGIITYHGIPNFWGQFYNDLPYVIM